MNASNPVALFVLHSSQLPWYGVVGEILKDRWSFETVLTVTGASDAERGREQDGYDTVYDLTETYDGSGAGEAYEDLLSEFRGLEEGQSNWAYRESVAIDRFLRGRGWSDEKTAGFAHHFLTRFREIVETIPGGPDIAFGEDNSLAYRIAHAVLPDTVPYIHFSTARHWSGRFWWDEGHSWDWQRCRDLYREYSKGEIPSETEALAERKVRSIRGGEQPGRNRPGRPPSVKRVTGGFRRWIDHHVRDRKTHESSRNPRMDPPRAKSPLVRLARVGAERARSKYWEHVASSQPPSEPQVASLFLHSEPEYRPYKTAFEFTDQFHTAEVVAARLPADFKLCVKEHPHNRGTRSLSDIRKMVGNPTIEPISPSVSPSDLIDESEFVLTSGGSVALEALARETPTILFGDMYFAEFDGILPVTSLTRVGDAVEDCLSGRDRPTRRSAVCALAAMHEASYPFKFGRYPIEEIRAEENKKRIADSLEDEFERRGVI